MKPFVHIHIRRHNSFSLANSSKFSF